LLQRLVKRARKALEFLPNKIRLDLAEPELAQIAVIKFLPAQLSEAEVEN
jgi:uncharacterized protein YqeY